MKKPKRTIAENREIVLLWKEVQAFALANPAIDKDGSPLPNPLVDALYIAGTNAAKALQ